jgi:hypothetical protein
MLKLPGKTVCLPSDRTRSRSVPSVLVGALFKKFGLLLKTPRISYLSAWLFFLDHYTLNMKELSCFQTMGNGHP